MRNVWDSALLLAGRDLPSRASETVALTVADHEASDGGMLVQVRRQKTTTQAHTYHIGPEACDAVRASLARAGIAQGGPVFQSLAKGGNATGKPLTTRDVRRTLKTLAVTAPLKARQEREWS